MTFFVIIAMMVFVLAMVLMRKYDLIIWPVWTISIGYCLFLIKQIEQPHNAEVGMYPGSAMGLVILATALYLLLAGAVGRILRKLFRQNKMWQQWALFLSVLLILLPVIGVTYLEITT